MLHRGNVFGKVKQVLVDFKDFIMIFCSGAVLKFCNILVATLSQPIFNECYELIHPGESNSL